MIAFIDVETTGLNPETNYITQIGLLIDTGKTIDKLDLLINPPSFPPSYDIEVARITGLTKEILENNGMSPVEAYQEFTDFLQKYVKKNSKKKKIHICGKNVNFDKRFLEVFFEQNDEKMYQYFYPNVIDIDSMVAYLEATGKIALDKHTLGAYCEYFGVKLDNAHNAMADIEATREVLLKAMEVMKDANV